MSIASLTRREAVLKGALAFGSLSLKSLVTGLPLAFWQGASAATAAARFVILSHGNAGDPINTNAPGTYGDPNHSGDPLHQVEHPPAADFKAPTRFSLGSQSTLAAKPWSELAADLRQRLGFWHHGTYINAHPDFDLVRRFNGALRGADGTGTDELSAFIAGETAPVLGTLQRDALTLGGERIQSGTRQLPQFSPLQLRNLFNARVENLERMMALRDQFIDRAYAQVSQSGTPAERAFLDHYALSRAESKTLGNALGELLSNVTNDDARNQARVAAALIKLQIAPVITLLVPFGGDNHHDSILSEEVAETRAAITNLNGLWSDLKALGVQDQTVFATLNPFGRTLRRNTNGGRNHNGDHHVMTVFGPTVKGAVIGGLEPVYHNGQPRDFRATPIDPTSGSAASGGIPFNETLAAVGKTLAVAAGISAATVDRRIAGGQVIRGALTQV